MGRELVAFSVNHLTVVHINRYYRLCMNLEIRISHKVSCIKIMSYQIFNKKKLNLVIRLQFFNNKIDLQEFVLPLVPFFVPLNTWKTSYQVDISRLLIKKQEPSLEVKVRNDYFYKEVKNKRFSAKYYVGIYYNARILKFQKNTKKYIKIRKKSYHRNQIKLSKVKLPETVF